MKRKTLFVILLIILLSLFWGGVLFNTGWTSRITTSILILILIAIVLGVISEIIIYKSFQKEIRNIQNANFTHMILFVISISISAILSGLISIPIAAIPGLVGQFGPIFVTFLIFLVMNMLFSYRKESFCDLAYRLSNGKIQMTEIAETHEANALLDTSVIIDGRIADIAHCGFIPGNLIVPNFILQELQFIADSEDAQRRQRGRRGLETLANMQRDNSITISIKDFDIPNIREADAKLMHVAMELECPILTNDYNLNKVAELQGIRILNVNDLTNAVKSILLPGEKLNVNVIQEGKEINQGVGYMEDGTMVVVENGRPFLGQHIDVVVTKILQTAAGRMIFARHEKELGVKR